MITLPRRYANFQWAFSTLGCPELKLDEICQLARDFDLSWIELRAIDKRTDLPVLFEEQFGTPENLARFLRDQKVNICSLDTSLKMVGNEEADRKEFLEYLPWADAIGTKSLRVFDGGTVEAGLDEEAFTQAKRTLDWWLIEKERGDWKVDVAIETHDALVSRSSSKRILEAYPELKIIWDTHHTWKKANDPLESSWSQLGSHVCNVHVKDSISVPSARHPFTYVNLGDGEFPLEKALTLLDENGYTGNVSIEWERMWHPYLADIREALEKARGLNWF